ncbi:F0F1 ATP synthase subunit A [Patescibacteria group bacterium]|nr:F0F1 ATP synthase subunit A [Patescibacteria group bacterium]
MTAAPGAAVVTTTEIKHESTLFAEPIGQLGGFPVTNALITSVATVIVIVAFTTILRRRLREIPSGIQNAFETILEEALSLCDQVTGSRAITAKVFPLAFSVFIFILINNWIGLLPLGGFGLLEKTSAGLSFVPFLRSGSADLNTTLALAVMAVIGANVFGIFSVGTWKLFNKYINLKALGGILKKIRHEPSVLVIAPVEFFVGILELIGEFAKIASLSFRLFGNVFAGEVLLAAMSAIFAYALPVPFMFLEIFVGAIQALIFAVLLLVYFTIAAQDHEGESRETAHAH